MHEMFVRERFDEPLCGFKNPASFVLHELPTFGTCA